MIENKKQSFVIIGAFIIALMLFTTTYAFFNYTRTGTANTIKTGRIAFNTNQTNTLTLTNLFPVAANSVGNDYTQDTLTINVTGDTTYGEGIEYLVTAEEVNVETNTGKKVPLTLKVDVTDDLGTKDTDSDQIEYFTDRGSTTSYYKILSESVLYDGQYLLVGYIAPGQSGIDGTINIKGFLDDDRIAISDTYDGEESDNMGTTSDWVNGRTVLTTTEWNSLQTAGNELSFKVRIEANEGIWVEEAKMINSATSIPAALKENITEIYFIKETPMRMEARYNAASVKADMTDTTLNEGKVLAWQENGKLYIASAGETYLPDDSAGYFSSLSNVTKIEFENINTSRVTYMNGMFASCTSLTDIDLSLFDTHNVTDMQAMFINDSSLTRIDLRSFDTSNVETMTTMFRGCSSLTSVDLTYLNTSNIEHMTALFRECTNLVSVDISGLGGDNLTLADSMFSQCTNLEEINMSNFNFGTSSMNSLFKDLTNLVSINLTNANTTGVTNMQSLFNGCSSIEVINLSGLGGSSLSQVDGIFNGCSSLKEVNMSGFNFGNVSYLDATFIASYGLTSLEKVDLSNSNLSNVSSYNVLFQNSSTLKIVDLTGVTIKSGAQFNLAFSGCSALETIKVSSGTDWTNLNLQATNMFSGCTSLVGGQGTTYDSSKIDASYAKVDGGEGNRGYFTASN